MFRKIALTSAFLFLGSIGAQAQLPLPLPLPLPTGTPEDRAACEPDVQRHCKAAIPDTMRVLSCLQANRQRISRPCQNVLTKYGQ
jgi:Cysteine rich repeat